MERKAYILSKDDHYSVIVVNGDATVVYTVDDGKQAQATTEDARSLWAEMLGSTHGGTRCDLSEIL